MNKHAVVLFNLGGPDSLENVGPFLLNLFMDPVILPLPTPFRYLLARWIVRRRRHEAEEIYQYLGGKSPLLDNTLAQARALEAALKGENEEDTKVFVAMRYWHPLIADVAQDVQAFDPDYITLLPLYPHYSITTTGSALAEWQRASLALGLAKPTRQWCCYPELSGFVSEMVNAIHHTLLAVPPGLPVRLLFSAHSLPQRIIEQGDPYQSQINRTAEAVMAQLNSGRVVDWRVCYQSKVGPLKWLEPATSDEIIRAGQEKLAVVVVPIAFVSEHSETLYELDKQYADLAHENAVPYYARVLTAMTGQAFIEGLKTLVNSDAKSFGGGCRTVCQKQCSPVWSLCPLNEKKNA